MEALSIWGGDYHPFLWGGDHHQFLVGQSLDGLWGALEGIGTCRKAASPSC